MDDNNKNPGGVKILNKKAQEMSIETMIYAAIFILGFAILIIFLSYKFAPAAEKSGNEAAINNWVLQTSQYRRTKIVLGSGLSLMPPVTSLLKQPIEINTKKQLLESNKLIADTMLRCFNAFDKGETDFLSPFDIYKTKPFCFPCAEIDLDKSLKGQSLALLNDYIKKQSPTTKKDETYDSLLRQQYVIPDSVESSVMYIYFTALSNTMYNQYINSDWFLIKEFEKQERNPIKAKIFLSDSKKISEICNLSEPTIPEVEAEQKRAETIEELMRGDISNE